MKKIMCIILCCILAVTCMVSFSACNDNGGESGGTSDSFSGGIFGSQQSDSMWTVYIDGKPLTLPVTLAEAEAIGVTLVSEMDRASMLDTPDSTFPMNFAWYGSDEGHYFQLKVITGSDTSKQAENATVTRWVNTVYGKDVFTLKDGIALGSTYDEVVAAFGSDYGVTTGPEDGDFTKGLAVIYYTQDQGRVLFYLTDGAVTYIEAMYLGE